MNLSTIQASIIAFCLSIFFLIAGFFPKTFILIWLGSIGGWWLVGVALLARAIVNEQLTK